MNWANLFHNYYEAFSVIVFSIGIFTMTFNRNLVKKIIGFNIMDSSIFLFLASKGYIEGRLDPILRNLETNAELYINPIPAGLVLTGIVVSVSVTAFSLALVQRIYKKYGTIDTVELTRISKMNRAGGAELEQPAEPSDI